LDWIDPDNFSRINGAEEFYYKGQGLPYTPRNYAIQYKDEVAFIKGMNKELYSKIELYLTMLPSTGFNPNTASDEVLMAYLNINEDSLKNLKDYMSKKNVTSDTELFAITGRRIASDVEGVYFFPSPFIEITVSAGRPRSIYTIRAGLDTRQNMLSPYNILYWREE
jgi:general secretion pathway protein K